MLTGLIITSQEKTTRGIMRATLFLLLDKVNDETMNVFMLTFLKKKQPLNLSLLFGFSQNAMSSHKNWIA